MSYFLFLIPLTYTFVLDLQIPIFPCSVIACMRVKLSFLFCHLSFISEKKMLTNLTISLLLYLLLIVNRSPAQADRAPYRAHSALALPRPHTPDAWRRSRRFGCPFQPHSPSHVALADITIRPLGRTCRSAIRFRAAGGPWSRRTGGRRCMHSAPMPASKDDDASEQVQQ
jgi:hypothetical protein